jgi:hypothetical protein
LKGELIMHEDKYKFIKISVGILIFNLLLILAICIIREDLNLVAYFHYMFYVGLINVILGFLVKVGSRETKAYNVIINYSLPYRKTSEEVITENIKDANKSTYFMLIFEIIGMSLVIISNVISKII